MAEENKNNESGNESGIIFENGFYRLSKKVYNDMVQYKQDCLKYKDQRNQSRIDNEGLEEKIKTLQDESVINGAENSTENDDLKLELKKERIMSAVKVQAVRMNINDPADIMLGDISEVQVLENGSISNVENCLIQLRTKKPYLFTDNTPVVKVDTTLGGHSSGVYSDEDLRKWTSVKIREAKKNAPGLYARWAKLATHGKEPKKRGES